MPFPFLGGLPNPEIKLLSHVLAGKFFTIDPPGKPSVHNWHNCTKKTLLSIIVGGDNNDFHVISCYFHGGEDRDDGDTSERKDFTLGLNLVFLQVLLKSSYPSLWIFIFAFILMTPKLLSLGLTSP